MITKFSQSTSVVVLGFYVPPTAKVIRRRGLGLKYHPKDWRSPGSNLGPLVYTSVKGDNLNKIKYLFCKFSLIDLLIILYQLTKIEAPSCYSFQDIMITNFQSPNLHREIIPKKKCFFFFKF